MSNYPTFVGIVLGRLDVSRFCEPFCRQSKNGNRIPYLRQNMVIIVVISINEILFRDDFGYFLAHGGHAGVYATVIFQARGTDLFDIAVLVADDERYLAVMICAAMLTFRSDTRPFHVTAISEVVHYVAAIHVVNSRQNGVVAALDNAVIFQIEVKHFDGERADDFVVFVASIEVLPESFRHGVV